LSKLPLIQGFDLDSRAVGSAKANVERAGLTGLVQIERSAIKDCHPERDSRGLLVVNPPYGERLGQKEEMDSLYHQIGDVLKSRFEGWQAAVFAGNPEFGKSMGLRARKYYTLYNGPMKCRLLLFDVDPQWFVDGRAGSTPFVGKDLPLSSGAEMFANRLKKNIKQLKRWAQREEISCFRVYDADLPEYAVAVDLYQVLGDDVPWLHVQEYEAPKSIDPAKAKQRLVDVMAMVPKVFETPIDHVVLKVRRKQKGTKQYERLGEENEYFEVQEGGCRFWVNFHDHLDTGLFLDHRPTRLMIQKMAKGKNFLNLFAYTGVATVHAAKGGAIKTTTADMSGTYLDWAKRNMALNGFAGAEHKYIQADCLEWLANATERYDLIFLDPPTFSTSKRMTTSLDIQRDHVDLILKASHLLRPDGVLIFSNNFRRFKMDRDALTGLGVEDISRATLPKDFSRNPRIHNCWRITHQV
jgi:23S rRNA (guanine2445-N2)-methyltransferase / 23S rRNA (guanine2069-N7)-methyltransferase